MNVLTILIRAIEYTPSTTAAKPCYRREGKITVACRLPLLGMSDTEMATTGLTQARSGSKTMIADLVMTQIYLGHCGRGSRIARYSKRTYALPVINTGDVALRSREPSSYALCAGPRVM